MKKNTFEAIAVIATIATLVTVGIALVPSVEAALFPETLAIESGYRMTFFAVPTGPPGISAVAFGIVAICSGFAFTVTGIAILAYNFYDPSIRMNWIKHLLRRIGRARSRIAHVVVRCIRIPFGDFVRHTCMIA